MTIQIEQETLLRVLQRPLPHPQPNPQSHPPLEGEEYVLVDFRNTFKSNDCSSVEKLQHSTFDDDDSVFTLSTASLSDSDSEVERSVSFAEDLVTQEWTRPYTPKEDVSKLFYSTEETQRFRQEYRLERKLLNELSVSNNPESVSIGNRELSALVATDSQPVVRHRISRVVVLHNDKLETFFNPDTPAPTPVAKKAVPSGDDFFDNDSFWSGSITWY